MVRQRISWHGRSRIARRSFTFALLLFGGFGWTGAAHAQDETLSVSPMSDMTTDGDASLRAYVAALPSAPTPKVEPISAGIIQPHSQIQFSADRAHSFYWLDRTALTYGLVQGGAEIFDGATTRYFIHHCSRCFENDPMSRLLLGTHPSWAKMIPAGIAEAAVSTYSYNRLSHSPHRGIRAAAPLVPIGLTAVHVIEGARNISLRNKYRCADPGYIVVGAFCLVAPPPVLIGTAGATDGGLGPRHSPL
jgi:hypothetical protein